MQLRCGISRLLINGKSSYAIGQGRSYKNIYFGPHVWDWPPIIVCVCSKHAGGFRSVVPNQGCRTSSKGCKKCPS